MESQEVASAGDMLNCCPSIAVGSSMTTLIKIMMMMMMMKMSMTMLKCGRGALLHCMTMSSCKNLYVAAHHVPLRWEGELTGFFDVEAASCKRVAKSMWGTHVHAKHGL